MRIAAACAAAACVALAPLLAADAHGHGLRFDVAPPVSFEGMDVTVSTELTPSDLTAEEAAEPRIGIRFFDNATGAALTDVTYLVEVWRRGDLLARDRYFSEAGPLDIDVRPVYGCAEPVRRDCTTHYGERDPISGGLIQRGAQPPVIQGPIFDGGGLYHLRVTVEGATGRTAFVDAGLEFDTFVSVAQEQTFLIDVPPSLLLPPAA